MYCENKCTANEVNLPLMNYMYCKFTKCIEND